MGNYSAILPSVRAQRLSLTFQYGKQARRRLEAITATLWRYMRSIETTVHTAATFHL